MPIDLENDPGFTIVQLLVEQGKDIPAVRISLAVRNETEACALADLLSEQAQAGFIELRWSPDEKKVVDYRLQGHEAGHA